MKKLIKTYEGKTLKQIKKEYPDLEFKYGKYHNFGDFGITGYEKNGKAKLFVSDDVPLMNRHVKAKHNNYTGTIANLDYSCELFINGESLGETSKHRAEVFLKYFKNGIEIDNSYLSSIRPINDFLPDASEKAKLKTEINRFVHELIEETGKQGHSIRNQIRYYAYTFGLDKAIEKYAS